MIEGFDKSSLGKKAIKAEGGCERYRKRAET
jgi:hypothetical protein